jgi:hypothetical protein
LPTRLIFIIGFLCLIHCALKLKRGFVMLINVNEVPDGKGLHSCFSHSLSSIPKLPAICLCFFAVSLPSVASAAINIDVPNGDFSEVGNAASKAPEDILGSLVLESYDEEFGSGPWSVDSDGLVGLLAPSADISSGIDGDATISGLVSAEVLEVVSTSSASVYQDDIGVTFTEGWTYTLTAEVTTENVVTLDVLSDAGVGIALSRSGSTIYADDTDSFVSLGLFLGQTSTITYTFTASAAEAGEAIGIDLYVGQSSGLATIDALGAVSFDNVTLTAVPEPSAAALLLGILGLGYVGLRRTKRAQ